MTAAPAPPKSLALIDGNNFYVSCERLFRPGIAKKAIVVASNNDGAVVSRSNEAKSLGIKMGVPVFQIRQLVRDHDVEVFSSNYALYADISNRMMTVISRFSPLQEIYSIDECFADFSGFSDIDQRARAVRDAVLRETGIPVCVGIGPSKTMAKLSNFIAKRHPRSQGIFNFNLLSDQQQISVLRNIPVAEVWGIGGRLSGALNAAGIDSALQLRDADAASMRQRFGVVMEKTLRELRGDGCIELEEVTPARKQIINSRSFGQVVDECEDLQDALAHFVSNAAKKLRDQHSVAAVLQVFIMTDRFRTDRPQYNPSVSIPMPIPTANTISLQKWAIAGLKQIYRPGYGYKKAGVILSEISSANQSQGDFFANAGTVEDGALMAALDAVNARYGKGTLKLSQDGSRRSWQMRQEHKSPAYTTNWDELPLCR